MTPRTGSAAAAVFAAAFAAAAARGGDGPWSGVAVLEADASGALEPLGETLLGDDAPEGLSGIAWLGEGGAFPASRFAFADDSGGRVRFADLLFDAASGAPTGCVFLASAEVPGAVDLEGAAFDPAERTLWLCDERGPALLRAAVGPDGASIARAERGPELPEELQRCRPNLALESVAAAPGGRLWTASESWPEGGEPGFAVLAGLATRGGKAQWTAAKFPLEPASGTPLPRLPAPWTGLCGLCALPDGRLVSLERSFGYEIAEGADGEPVQSLCRAAVSVAEAGPGGEVRKRVLWRAMTGNANYEGVCLGPELPGGGRLLVAVSDGDVSRRGGLAFPWKKSLLAFRLRPELAGGAP